MITFNKEDQQITCRAIYGDQTLPRYVVKKNKQLTLISESKTLYMYLDKPMTDYKECYRLMRDFASANTYNINFEITSFIPDDDEKMIVAIFEGLLYGGHKQVSMKTDAKSCQPNPTINIICWADKYKKMYEDVAIKMEMLNFARDLQDTPPNIMTSVALANAISEKAKSVKSIKISVLDKEQIAEKKMGLLLGVNAGSDVEARLVVLEYNGDPHSEIKTALVGKGITFDSGGYRLKSNMAGMKFDMSGAAIMCSTLMAAAKLRLPVNLVAIGCLTDNRIGSTATLPESVLTSMNGLTVQIDNPDAEGRLVLADGITYAIRECHATHIVEASTLTGGIVVSLGHEQSGYFANNEEFGIAFANAANYAGEAVWRMPVHPDNVKTMKHTPIADLTNSAPTRAGHSATAAAFLFQFVEDKPYLHLDIAGTADIKGRGTGVILRSVLRLVSKINK